MTAGPLGTVDRLRKFLRRHRTGVMVASVMTFALVVGLAPATTGFVKARRDRDRAAELLVEARPGVYRNEDQPGIDTRMFLDEAEALLTARAGSGRYPRARVEDPLELRSLVGGGG